MKFGPEIEKSSHLKARSHFFPFALGGHNAHGPEDSRKYYTLDALMQLNGGYISSPSFCSRPHGNAGHTFIDVLKIDIEGAEFDTLTKFLEVHKPASPFASTTLPFGQLQIELHAWDDYAKFDFFYGWWTALEDAGLRPFWTEANLVYVNYAEGAKPKLAEVGQTFALEKSTNFFLLQYSLINIHGNHSLIHEGAEEGAVAY